MKSSFKGACAYFLLVIVLLSLIMLLFNNKDFEKIEEPIIYFSDDTPIIYNNLVEYIPPYINEDELLEVGVTNLLIIENGIYQFDIKKHKGKIIAIPELNGNTIGTTAEFNDTVIIFITDIKECNEENKIFCSLEFTYFHELGHVYYNNLEENEKLKILKEFENELVFPRIYSKSGADEYYADKFALKMMEDYNE